MKQIRFQLPRILYSLLLLTAAGVLVHSVWAENRGAARKEVATGGPRLSVDSVIYDFDVVTQGHVVEHDFLIRNVGASELQIHAVQPSCGCSAAVSEVSTLAPGAKSKIHISFNTSGFHGYKVKTFRVFSNDPQQSTAVLTVQGTVRREIDVDPPRLYFGTLSKQDLRGSKASLGAKIVSDEHSSSKVLDVTSRSQDLKVNFVPGSKPSFSVTLRPDLPVGVLRSRVVVKTSSPATPVINVPVFARVEGDLRLSPQDVSFGLVEGPLSEPLVRTVSLINRGDLPLKILAIKSDRPDVKAESRVVKEGREYEIKVSVDKAMIGTLKARIEIRTDHPEVDQRLINLPVFGIISRKSE